MRILMISFDKTILTEGPAKPGDAQERHIKYAQALRQRYSDGHITVILRVPPSWLSQPVELAEGLKAYPVPCQRWAFLVKAIPVLKRLAKRERFHIVTTQSPFDDGFIGVWLKRSFGIPLNVQMRSSFLDLSYWIQERPILYRIANKLGKWVAHQADTIRVVSYGEKERLENQFPKLKGKVICLHPLANMQTFGEPVTDGELHQVQEVLKARALNNTPFLLFVGRFAAQKNLPTLLEAFALVTKRMPTAILVMVGDGPLENELKRLVMQLKIGRHVVWLGNLSLRSLRAWYAAARATVLPSYHEGFGKVIVESYLIGTPVIATPFVSAKELICNGQMGFVVPDFTNYAWLADRMVSLLTHPELAKEMGRKGKEHIQSYLLPESEYLERLVDIWRQTAYMASQMHR